MTSRRTRILWGLTGAFLFLGLGVSLILWLGPPEFIAKPALRELGALFDVMAVLFWMLVLAVSATYGPGSGSDDEPKK